MRSSHHGAHPLLLSLQPPSTSLARSSPSSSSKPTPSPQARTRPVGAPCLLPRPDQQSPAYAAATRDALARPPCQAAPPPASTTKGGPSPSWPPAAPAPMHPRRPSAPSSLPGYATADRPCRAPAHGGLPRPRHPAPAAALPHSGPSWRTSCPRRGRARPRPPWRPPLLRHHGRPRPPGSSLTAAAPAATAPTRSAVAAATAAATPAAATVRGAGLGLLGYPTDVGALALAIDSESRLEGGE